MRPGEPSKFDYARKLAAALVYVGLVRLDSILLQPFSAGCRIHCWPAAAGTDFKGARGLSARSECGRQDRLLRSRRGRFLRRYPQRGLVVILSDFLDDGDCLKPLQYMADFGHELLLVHVWGEEDRTPSDIGEIELMDAESGRTLKIAHR